MPEVAVPHWVKSRGSKEGCSSDWADKCAVTGGMFAENAGWLAPIAIQSKLAINACDPITAVCHDCSIVLP